MLSFLRRAIRSRCSHFYPQGWNIDNFDLPFLLKRADTVGIADTFCRLGRVRSEVCRIRLASFENKQRGRRDYSEITNLAGRVQLDMLEVTRSSFKLRTYTLNAVAEEFLGDRKEDVHHSIIADLWRESDGGRARLCSYCLKDAKLPQRLMDKFCIVPQYAEMARVCGVPFAFLRTRGQQVKVLAQLLPRARERGFLLPYIPVEPSDEKYEGAVVIDPLRGFYEKPIATLDFTSLYPSIMMAHNLCYTTFLPGGPEEAERLGLGPDDYTVSPNGHCFVKAHVRKGILPTILESLLGARKLAKRDMASAKEMAELAADQLERASWEFRAMVQDGRQLALKVSANSVYGFTGATVGMLPCLEISSSVTAFGREMIWLTKEVVEREFPGSRVIYGDTDSVMVEFAGADTVQKAMDLGRAAVELVNEYFLPPISLAFEKVFYPYLLISKKRYMGGFWTRSDKMDKVDAKGVESVRRDNCRMLSEAVKIVSDILMTPGTADASGTAVSYVKGLVADLLQGRVDTSKLVISKAYTKEAEEYASKQAHVELVRRIKRRTPDMAPQIGDRIPYVIVGGTKGARAFEKVEDPVYAMEHDIPLDVDYYINNQLKKPMRRIFGPVLGTADMTEEQAEELAERVLFTGEHVRRKVLATPTDVGIGRYCVQRPRCRVCGVPDCRSCETKEKMRGDLADLERRRDDLWATCRECQGNDELPVLCTNRDCEIYYERTLVKSKCGRERQRLLDW